MTLLSRLAARVRMTDDDHLLRPVTLPDFFTPRGVCKRWGISRRTLSKILSTGGLDVMQLANRTRRITGPSVQRYEEKHRIFICDRNAQ